MPPMPPIMGSKPCMGDAPFPAPIMPPNPPPPIICDSEKRSLLIRSYKL